MGCAGWRLPCGCKGSDADHPRSNGRHSGKDLQNNALFGVPHDYAQTLCRAGQYRYACTSPSQGRRRMVAAPSQAELRCANFQSSVFSATFTACTVITTALPGQAEPSDKRLCAGCMSSLLTSSQRAHAVLLRGGLFHPRVVQSRVVLRPSFRLSGRFHCSLACRS